jgi:hypothetical protein
MPFAEEFLHHPDRFPAGPHGEPWGSEEVVIDFARGPYRFVGLSVDQVEEVRRRFAGLCREPVSGEAALQSSLFRASQKQFRSIDLAGWESTLDFDYAARAVRFAGLMTMGRLDWCPALRGALWPCDGDDFLGPFENFFRILVAYRLQEAGGVLLHSAGVVDGQGRATLFLGRSGAGKTTLSRLCTHLGLQILSDDLNALCPGPEGTVVEKMPFAGDFGTTSTPFRAYPLRALCRLEKGTEDRVEEMSAAQSLALLVACSPGVNGDPHRLERLQANLEAALAEAATVSLTFSLAGTFWEALEGYLGR